MANSRKDMCVQRKNLDYPKPKKPRLLRLSWTCSDYTHHEHRWYWVAWLCSWIQKYWLKPTGPKCSCPAPYKAAVTKTPIRHFCYCECNDQKAENNIRESTEEKIA